MPSLSPESHEAPLVWLWMAMLAYPDLFDMDLRQEVKQKFQAMYEAELTDDDFDNIMHMSANGDSAHYREMFGR
jgi:iron complex transport system substrate-binding protein